MTLQTDPSLWIEYPSDPIGGIHEREKRRASFWRCRTVILAALFLTAWVGDSFFFHWSTFLADSIPNSIRNALLGIAILITFLLFMTGPFVISGKERPGCVVDTGPFHYVRHPIYLAALMAYIGTAISSLSLISIALLIPIFVFYNYIASYEEKLMVSKFGEPYRAYERRTGKWLPRAGTPS